MSFTVKGMSWQPREDLLHRVVHHASKEEKQGSLRRALSNCIVTTPEDGAKLALEMFLVFWAVCVSNSGGQGAEMSVLIASELVRPERR